jgi:hypothetical protein
MYKRHISTIKTETDVDVFNIVFTVHLVYIKNQDQLDAQSLLKTLIVVLH